MLTRLRDNVFGICSSIRGFTCFCLRTRISAYRLVRIVSACQNAQGLSAYRLVRIVSACQNAQGLSAY